MNDTAIVFSALLICSMLIIPINSSGITMYNGDNLTLSHKQTVSSTNSNPNSSGYGIPEKAVQAKKQTGESFKIYKAIENGITVYVVVYYKGNLENITGSLTVDNQGKVVKTSSNVYNVPALLLSHGSGILQQKNEFDKLSKVFSEHARKIKQERTTFAGVHMAVSAIQITSYAIPGLNAPNILKLAIGIDDISKQNDLSKIHSKLESMHNHLEKSSKLASDLSRSYSKLTKDGGDATAAYDVRIGNSKLKQMGEHHRDMLNDLIQIIDLSIKLGEPFTTYDNQLKQDKAKIESAKKNIENILNTKGLAEINFDKIKNKLNSLKRN